jgi:serine O-acetyltransferase
MAVMKWRLRRLGRRLGIELPLNVFGPGLAVVHPFGIVVSRKARIGKNCRIHAGVNVGEHRGNAPSIGDNVYLGPGAKIVGGVKIGDRAVVGANAVVVKDVPAGVTVGGVPARVISNADSASMIPSSRRSQSDD